MSYLLFTFAFDVKFGTEMFLDVEQNILYIRLGYVFQAIFLKNN